MPAASEKGNLSEETHAAMLVLFKKPGIPGDVRPNKLPARRKLIDPPRCTP